MKTLLKIIAVVLVLAAIAFAYKIEHEAKQPASFGSFTPVGANQTTLSGSGVIASATSIPLTSFKTPDGRPLVMSMFGSIGYAVIDPNSPSKIEDITFSGITQNGNGTAVLTGVSRGLDFVSPYLASTTLAQAHAGGAYLILSNTAGFYGQQFLFANGNSTSSAIMVFGSTTPPRYDAEPIWANFTTEILASVAYVNSVVAAGAANASETVKGIVQLATAAQLAAGTSAGSTLARLGIPNSLATSTPTAGCTTGCVPVAVNGKLSQLFLDLTQFFNFTSLQAASSTLASTSITTANINTLNVQNFNAAAGVLYNYQDFTSSGTWTKPSGLAGTELVQIIAWGQGGGGGGSANGGGSGGGGGGACVQAIYPVSSLGSTVTVTIGNNSNAGASGGVGGVGANSTFGTILTAYGGGGGANGTNSSNTGGGGGGGTLSVGLVGTVDGAGGVGGSPAGSAAILDNSGYGGGGGGTTGTGGNSAYGGAGGGASGSGVSGGAGGNTVCGGGGGGGGGSSGQGTGGTSLMGGAGGAGGNVGVQPGGGGGGGQGTGAVGFKGGAGEVRVWVIK